MSLRIIKSDFATPQTLIRYFHKTEVEWARHMAEETQLDCGTAFCNRELPRTYMANRVLDARLPDGMSPVDAVRMAEEHFAQQEAPCWQWVMNPSADESETRPLVDHLLANGHTRVISDMMHLEHLPTQPIRIRSEGLTIIPARASFKHTRILMEESASMWHTPELADAAMMHLDDPHYDALLALKDGAPVAHVGVLAIGEIGLVEQVYVAEAARGQGISTVMMARAIEICARSLFKHVFLAVNPANDRAKAVYTKFGFRKIGDFVAYQRPGD